MSTVSTAQESHQNVSSTESPIYTLFDLAVVDELDRKHLLDLFAGVLGSIRIRGFSTADEGAAIVEALADCPMGSYNVQTVVPFIAKLGPAAYDFYGEHGLTDDYWGNSEESSRHRSKLMSGIDPLDYAVAKLSRAWGAPLRRATSGGREMFAGMIRETNGGMRLHWDEIAREFPGALDDMAVCQIAFNWYVSMPEQGGESVVYRHKWRPADEAHREGYGYQESVYADEPCVSTRPEAGDAVLFDPRNYHTVRPSVAGRRISMSFFLGITGDGSLIYWS